MGTSVWEPSGARAKTVVLTVGLLMGTARETYGPVRLAAPAHVCAAAARREDRCEIGSPVERATHRIDTVPISSDHDRDLIYHGNAERILKLR